MPDNHVKIVDDVSDFGEFCMFLGIPRYYVDFNIMFSKCYYLNNFTENHVLKNFLFNDMGKIN